MIKEYLKTKYLSKVLFLLLFFLFSNSFIASMLFIFKINISWFTFILAIVFLLGAYYFVFYKNSSNKKEFYYPLLFTSVLIFLIILISCFMKEGSWDGWAYHLPSIIHLKNGWNPIYDHNESIGIWSLHYPKFIWIYGAVLYTITGNMFAGTSFNIIIALSIFVLALDFLKNLKCKTMSALILSFIISCNAIAIGQFWSYYNDGVLGNCIWGLLIIFYAISKKVYKLENNYMLIWIIGIYASILANIKFDGALFAFLIVAFMFIYFLCKKFIHFNKFLIISCFIIGISVLSIAINTYLPNFIYHKNIGYPIIGDDKQDIIGWFVPDIYINKGHLTSFSMSIFADPKVNDKFVFKPFYKITRNDLTTVISTESSRYGFGFGYQVIIILSLVLLVIAIFKCMRKYKNKGHFISTLKQYSCEISIILLITIMFYITPATWWFRYIPYMYIFPLVILLFFKKNWNLKGVFNKISCVLIIVYFFYGSALLCGKLYSQCNYAIKLSNNISDFKEIEKNGTLFLREYDRLDNYYKELVRKTLLDDYKISYQLTEDETCEIIGEYYIFGIRTVRCSK